jgi:NRAMP (natural resistance-associated macrophage protein)-like metal ion transporter
MTRSFKDKLKYFIEEAAASPAVALDKSASFTHKLVNSYVKRVTIKKIGKYWNSLGPGLTTGAADDDPSGIATYSQTGAQSGLQLLWLAIVTFPLMSIIQEMCARIGLVTGRGLAGNMRKYYPRYIIYSITVVLFVSNTLNLGADIGAMAQATRLLFPSFSFYLLVILFCLFMLLLLIFTSYKTYAKYLKWLAFILFTYIFSAMSVKGIDLKEVARHTFIPSITFSKDQLILITAILGTTISPYLFFWQTSQENEEQILAGETSIEKRQDAVTKKGIREMRYDVWLGMLISNLVMFFIILTCAYTLHLHGITTITTAAQAASALKPIAGDQAYLLFAMGIIGTGLLAVPVLAGSASYALSESLRWKLGLYKDLKQASSFYGVIIISMLIGILINFVGLDPIKTLIYSAVLNGLTAPFVLFFIVKISSNRSIMNNWVNHPFITVTGWVTTGIMAIVAVATIFSFFF